MKRLIAAIQEQLIILVFDGPPLGPFAPWILALGLGRWPHRKKD